MQERRLPTETRTLYRVKLELAESSREPDKIANAPLIDSESLKHLVPNVIDVLFDKYVVDIIPGDDVVLMESAGLYESIEIYKNTYRHSVYACPTCYSGHYIEIWTLFKRERL